VVIGRGGRQALELDRAAIAADGVPLYRRPGGGCAVVLDAGNLTAALGLPLDGVGGITRAFGAISRWLIAGLEACGAPGVVQEGTSDMVLGGRKVGGSCIWRTRGLVYYATTLLVAPDLDLVERWLPHPPREPLYRGGRKHRDFMGRLAGTGAAEPTEMAANLESRLAETLPTLLL
jgi:lipoate-protein ligase A